MKTSLRFVSWLDILDMQINRIPYILFKLKEIKKERAISWLEHTFWLFSSK